MKPRTVLVVDDEEMFANNLAEHFERTGWKSKAVFSGPECVDVLRTMYFDVIVLDMRMPEMDGFATLRQILDIQKDACVVFLTAYGKIESAVKALHMGAVNLISKPVPFNTLVALADDAIQRKKNEIDARMKEHMSATLNLALGLAHRVKNGLNSAGLRIKLATTDRTREEFSQHLAEAQQMLDLTNLAVRRLYRFSQAQHIQVVSVNLRKQVMKAIETAELRHSNSGSGQSANVVVSVPGDVEVMADEEFLSEAIECLIDNAMDSTHSGGKIMVSCKDNNKTIELIVDDDGPGFPIEMMNIAHQPFKTARGKTHIGFGLAFAQQVVQSCKGELKYGNIEENAGARVTLTLLSARYRSNNHT